MACVVSSGQISCLSTSFLPSYAHRDPTAVLLLMKLSETPQIVIIYSIPKFCYRLIEKKHTFHKTVPFDGGVPFGGG
jgi:hypothetical protein